jgi:capsular polysaccharide biosynthesis protein
MLNAKIVRMADSVGNIVPMQRVNIVIQFLVNTCIGICHSVLHNVLTCI